MAADEQAILAEALLQESALPYAQAGSKRRNPPEVSKVLPGHVGQREFVSTGFMNSLCAEVDSLLEGCSVLSDVRNFDAGNQLKAASPWPLPTSAGDDSPRQSLASSASPGRRHKETSGYPDKAAERSPWSIKARAHAPTGYSLFSHDTESQASSPNAGQKSPSNKSADKSVHAVYKRSVEFLEQKKAKLAEQMAKKEQQENDSIVGPQISARSKQLVRDKYTKPWEGRPETSKAKNKALADIHAQQARESAEHTFQPQIDKRSRNLFRHVLDNGEPWHNRMHSGQSPSKSGWKDRSKQSRMEERLTFQPAITQKARQLEEQGFSTDQLHRCNLLAHAREKDVVSSASEPPSLERTEDEISDHEALEAIVQRFVIDGQPKNPSTRGAAKLTELLRRKMAEAPEHDGGAGPIDVEEAGARPFEETTITAQSSASEGEGDTVPETADEDDSGSKLAAGADNALQQGNIVSDRRTPASLEPGSSDVAHEPSEEPVFAQAHMSPEQGNGEVEHEPSQKAGRTGSLKAQATKSAQPKMSRERNTLNMQASRSDSPRRRSA